VTTTVDLDAPQRALAIGAHPDDIEFGAGATLAKWAASGCEVSLLVCTDGSKGSWDPASDPAELAAIRQQEQRFAAEALGVTGDVIFLRWIDGELESGLRQRSQVAAAIRRLRPQVVLGHDPWKRYRLHPDHRHAGHLAVDGVVAARDPHFFPELERTHHRPETLLLFEPDEIDHVETTAGFEGAKLAALEAHSSQFESTMFATNDEEIAAFRRRILEDLATHGAEVGAAMGEPFHRIDL
jgi:LmbE family N-acetylglucosaminyl deacetylase